MASWTAPDAAEDLDAPPVGPARSAGAAGPGGAAPVGPGPRRARRGGPWLVPLLVTALVVGGGALAARQARALAEADLLVARDLAQVRVGGAEVDHADVLPVPGADGRMDLDVHVAVVNGGDQPLSVTVAGLSVEHAALARPVAATAVAARSSSVVDLPLAVDCRAVPPLVTTPSGAVGPSLDEPAPPTGWVDLGVDLRGQHHDERYPTSEVAGTGLDAALPWLCGSGRVRSATTATSADGRLLVEAAGSADGAGRVVLSASAALRATTAPALPAAVAAGEGMAVAVSLDPDCGALSPGAPVTPGGGLPSSDLQVLYSTDPDTAADSGYALNDAVVTAAWVARQVALACG